MLFLLALVTLLAINQDEDISVKDKKIKDSFKERKFLKDDLDFLIRFDSEDF